MVCWDDDGEILRLSVTGKGQRHLKGQFLPFPEHCTSHLYKLLCVFIPATKNDMLPVRTDVWDILYMMSL